MTNKKTYDNLDVVKWLSALLIIIIHTNPFHEIEIIEFFTKDVVARIAVPLFFAISGFLFFRKITFENGKIVRTSQNLAYLLRYVKHLIIIYLGASAFYLLYKIPMWYSIGWWGLPALKDYLVCFFLSGSEYHLWYIIASIYGIILFYLLLSFIRLDIMKYLCIAGWLIECLLYSYSWIGIENISVLTWMTSHFSGCFDAAFRAIPLMSVGLFCAIFPSKKIYVISSILTTVVYVSEVSFLYFISSNDGKYSYLLITPLLTYFLLRWLLSMNLQFKNRSIPKWMRDTSLIIYIVHPMVIYLLDFAGMPKGIMHWLAVTMISVGAASIFISVKNKLKLIYRTP